MAATARHKPGSALRGAKCSGLKIQIPPVNEKDRLVRLAHTCSMLTSSSVGRTPAAVISQPCVRARPNAAQGSAPSTSYSRPDPCTSRRAPRQRGLAARAAAVAEASTGLDVSTVCPHPRWQRAITSVGQPHEPCLHRVRLASIRFLRLQMEPVADRVLVRPREEEKVRIYKLPACCQTHALMHKCCACNAAEHPAILCVSAIGSVR